MTKKYQGDITSRIQPGNATGKNTQFLLYINYNEKEGLTDFDWETFKLRNKRHKPIAMMDLILILM